VLPDAVLDERRLRLEVPAQPSEVARVRHAVVDLLVRAGIPSTVVDDIELVVSELVSNAVVHGRPAPVSVDVGIGHGEVAVAVSNRGSPDAIPAVESWVLPAPQALSGRGLAIVRRLSDRVDVRGSGENTVVVVRRRVPGGSGPS